MHHYTVFYPGTFWGKFPPKHQNFPQEFSATPAVKLKIMDFLKFQFLTIGTVNRVELHHRAKFRQNRSCRGRNMAIFRFLQMAAAAILDFQTLKFLTAERSRWANCTSVPNFVKIDQTAAEILRFFNFSRWRPPPS